MKLRAPMTLIVLLFCSAAWGQAEKPPIDLSVYPGGESTMEMNIANEDVLPMLSAMLPLVAGKLGKLAEAITPEEVASIFKDVRRMEFLQVDVAKQGVTEQQVIDYYAKTLPSGQWSRVFWQSKSPAGTIGVYSQKDTEMLYGFRVRTVVVDGRSVKRVEVAKIEGKVDFAKLMSMASKVLAAKAGEK